MGRTYLAGQGVRGGKRAGLSGLWQRNRDFERLKQGQVAVLLALSILPIAAVAGFAVDFQLLTSRKSKAQYTLDSSVIAGTRAYREGASASTVEDIVQTYFSSALTSSEGNLDCSEPVVSIDDTDVNATTNCSMETTLSAIAGITELEFAISTSTTYGVGKLDVAFVFDVSGSMDGSRMRDLKIAAHDAVNTLMPENPPPGQEDDIRLSMVSYNGAFNAGPYFEAVTGTAPDENVGYEYKRYNGHWYRVPFYYTTTCIFERSGHEADTDAPPGEGQYMMVASHTDRNLCNNANTPLALTSNEEPLHDYIDALDPDGGTAGHLGVAWAWYMISPNWASILPSDAQPQPYDEPDSAKAIVLMTDGDFNAVGSSYNGSSSSQARDLCEEIKKKDIVIYSVAFQAPSAGESVLKDCASGDQNFFKPQDGEELNDAYRAIAASISDLRITH